MSLDANIRQHIESLAREALQRFDDIATAAANETRRPARHNSDVLAYTNPTGEVEVQRRRYEVRQAFEQLRREPAIARVVINDDGRRIIWYICRATPLTSVERLASYRSPIGRMASQQIGSEFNMPNGSTVVILEQAQFRPFHDTDGWDSKRTVVTTEQIDTITVNSLKMFVSERDNEDIIGQLLADEQMQVGIVEGIRRQVIERMALRDQPVLDQYQDEIFRLPLNSKLLIVGPPGTGKTTTLIRRLGQKLDPHESILSEGERRLIDGISRTPNALPHRTSWMMFTPTTLLKEYVQEAFAREGIPSSNENITTWESYRRELARNEFRILRKSGAGVFVLKDDAPSLLPEVIDTPRPWFVDFDEWQHDRFLKDLSDAARSLEVSEIRSCRRMGGQLGTILARAQEGPLSSLFEGLDRETPNIRSLVSDLKATSDQRIDRALEVQLRGDRNFLQALADYLKDLNARDEEDEGEEEEENDDAASNPWGAPLTAARNSYRRAVRAQARATASDREMNEESRDGMVVTWIGDRALAEDDRVRVGQSLMAQTALRRFLKPIRRYVDRMAQRYREFRRVRQQEEKWYRNDRHWFRDIHPLEVDVVLLAILRVLQDRLGTFASSQLEPYVQIYRNQIVVDEATDFSPIQLACMSALAHPQIRSFFACGDFNQRLTVWGTRRADDLKWACSGIEIKEISVPYRQTKQLSDLTRAMIGTNGELSSPIELPRHVESDGFSPVLLEDALIEKTIEWLAERLREIDSHDKKLPSTAILVNSENDVESVATALSDAVAEQNINVVPCPLGQAVGQDNDVRIFNVEHIKGLEFEAVFFIAVDRLAEQEPTLFEKYLYVGASRAATYLGITCEGELPSAMVPLRSHFGADWGENAGKMAPPG